MYILTHIEFKLVRYENLLQIKSQNSTPTLSVTETVKVNI